MPGPKGIVWLSSYPKSGNTWFRILLARILNKSTTLNDINEMDSILGSPMVANRAWMNQALGFDSQLLNDQEVDFLRPTAYQWVAQQLKQTTFIKIHDAYTHLEDKTPLIPTEGCLGAIYFIRNPLDVAISLAHHAKCPIDWSIQMMANPEFAVPFAGKKDKQLRQQLLSWSLHVQSWIANPSIPLLVLRYEDMFFKPLETFSRGMNFLNVDISSQALQQAIDDTSFDKLQDHEKQHGFKEKPALDRPFFRKGIVGDWENTLTEQQVQRVIADHSEMMQAYGYLDENNRPMPN